MGGDLISREALIDHITGHINAAKNARDFRAADAWRVALWDVQEAPAIDAAPLTFEEATADDYYLEIKGEKYVDVALNVFALDTGGYGYIDYVTHSNPRLVLRKADYGRTWRCWARRPTEAEREAARWNG